MWRRILLATCLTIVPFDAERAAAQPVRPAPGDRVRITSATSQRLEGRLERWAPDSIGIEVAPGNVRATPWSIVSRVEVARPRTAGRGALRGLGWGALVGGVTGGFAVLAGGDDYFDPEDFVLPGALFFGAVGAGTGAVIGAFNPGDRWEEVPMEIAIEPGPLVPQSSSQPAGSSSSHLTRSNTVRQPLQ